MTPWKNEGKGGKLDPCEEFDNRIWGQGAAWPLLEGSSVAWEQLLKRPSPSSAFETKSSWKILKAGLGGLHNPVTVDPHIKSRKNATGHKQLSLRVPEAECLHNLKPP